MLVSKLVVVGDHCDESKMNECICKLKTRCRFDEREGAGMSTNLFLLSLEEGEVPDGKDERAVSGTFKRI